MFRGDPNDEASMSQLLFIQKLLDRRLIRKKTASKIIEMLLDEREFDNELSNLKKIQRPQ